MHLFEKLKVRPGFEAVYGKSGDYKIVVDTMKDVFTKYGHRAGAIDASLQRGFGVGQDQAAATKPAQDQGYDR